MPIASQSIEWIAFASNAFNALVPLYARMEEVPAYFGNTTLKVDSNAFYWASRLIGAMVDSHFQMTANLIERYQDAVANRSRAILAKYDALIKDDENAEKTIALANDELAAMAEEETSKALNSILFAVSCLMKNGFARSDN